MVLMPLLRSLPDPSVGMEMNEQSGHGKRQWEIENVGNLTLKDQAGSCSAVAACPAEYFSHSVCF